MPERGYPTGGWRRAYETRLRPTWFGLVVIEELWECEDGRRQWRRCWKTHSLPSQHETGGGK